MPRKRATPSSTTAPERVTRHFTRWTGPREEVFNVLVRTRQHLSAKDLFGLIRPSSPDIGLTTVYRTLELLDKARLVRKVSTQSGEVRFEYRHGDRNDHHHHLICTGCGKIVNYRDFEKDELDLVRRCEALLAEKYGFLIRDHNIDYIGLCPDCRPGGPRSPVRSPSTESKSALARHSRKNPSRKEAL